MNWGGRAYALPLARSYLTLRLGDSKRATLRALPV